jgi:hypothetical protein
VSAAQDSLNLHLVQVDLVSIDPSVAGNGALRAQVEVLANLTEVEELSLRKRVALTVFSLELHGSKVLILLDVQLLETHVVGVEAHVASEVNVLQIMSVTNSHVLHVSADIVLLIVQVVYLHAVPLQDQLVVLIL